MGHGPALTDAEIVEILERMPEGFTLKASCEKSKRGYANVVRRISESPELKKLHAQVREEYIRNRVQEMHYIARTYDPARARVMIDVIKWESARVLPKEFGDRVQQEITVTHNKTLHERMHKARARAGMPPLTELPPATSTDDDDA